MGIGELAALSAAALWATASLLYGRTNLSAWGMNLCKNVFATVLLLVQLAVLSVVMSRPMFAADAHAWWWLGLSGLIGIVLGDTCYFRSLQILGPRRALIVSTTAPVMTAGLGWLFLAESHHVLGAVGMVVTLLGVMTVISESSQQDEAPGLFPGTILQGIVFGVLASLCMAIGSVASKHGMQACDSVEASFIRLSVSAVASLIIVWLQKHLRTTIEGVVQPGVMKRLIPAAICGTWLGIWLSQVGYKHASTVAIAVTLLSTSPLFVIPLVRVFYGIRVSARAIVGTLIAIAGIAMLASG